MWVKFCHLLMLKKQVPSVPSVCNCFLPRSWWVPHAFGHLNTHSTLLPISTFDTSNRSHHPSQPSILGRNDAFASRVGPVISIEQVLFFFSSLYNPDSLVSSEPMRYDQVLRGLRFSMNSLHCGSGGPCFNKHSVPDTKELDTSF